MAFTISTQYFFLVYHHLYVRRVFRVQLQRWSKEANFDVPCKYYYCTVVQVSHCSFTEPPANEGGRCMDGVLVRSVLVTFRNYHSVDNELSKVYGVSSGLCDNNSLQSILPPLPLFAPLLDTINRATYVSLMVIPDLFSRCLYCILYFSSATKQTVQQTVQQYNSNSTTVQYNRVQQYQMVVQSFLLSVVCGTNTDSTMRLEMQSSRALDAGGVVEIVEIIRIINQLAKSQTK